MDQTKWVLIKRKTKRPKATLKKLLSSIAEIEMSAHWATLNLTFHTAGLPGKVEFRNVLRHTFGDTPDMCEEVLY